MFSELCLSGFLQFLQTAIFTVGYISGTQLFPEPLRSDEEQLYLERLSAGDEEARNILIEKNLRLVAHVCKKYSNSNVDQDDLISIGTIGRELIALNLKKVLVFLHMFLDASIMKY